MYYSKGDAMGTNVSVRYRRSGRLSEVVVKRGSTVVQNSTNTTKTTWIAFIIIKHFAFNSIYILHQPRLALHTCCACAKMGMLEHHVRVNQWSAYSLNGKLLLPHHYITEPA